MIMGFFEKKQANKQELLMLEAKAKYASELSKLKFSIPEYIKSSRELSEKILGIKTASQNQGGEGALVIKLKITK